MKRGKRIIKIVLLSIVGVLLFGILIMMLWNWLVPDIFKGPEITFWQALGLFLLAKILFGGWGGGGRWRHGYPGQWRNRYYEKLSTMTPEERERFKQRMTEKWCRPKRDEPGANV
jgi:hypothetical protein